MRGFELVLVYSVRVKVSTFFVLTFALVVRRLAWLTSRATTWQPALFLTPLGKRHEMLTPLGGSHLFVCKPRGKRQKAT